ncbi:hematopoietic progenitor cell antigen CD34 isoform X2 [Notamacropus eugenii]|uniref:hematopoietic progenitor cell antigen CD34 isoform X2 n=1 Tax=Notamacropus eugenii TaxID=9315 RepID=UPI003B671AAB
MLLPRSWRAGLRLQLWATLICLLSSLSQEGATTEKENFEKTVTLPEKIFSTTSPRKGLTTETLRNTSLSPSVSPSHGPSSSSNPSVTYLTSSPAPASTQSTTPNPEISEPETQNSTSTSGVSLTSAAGNSSAINENLPVTVMATTHLTTTSPSSPEVTVMTSMSETTSSSLSNGTNPTTISAEPSLTSVVPVKIEKHIKCLQIKQVQASKGICLELNETYSCEDFKKTQGDNLTKVVCEPKVSESQAGTQDCTLILAQSEVNPSCLFLVLDSKSDISHMLQVMNKHKSNLEKLGIQDFQQQDIRSHQSYSRKTLIALVTSGLLLAALGTAGYFLMNRRSWSPAGERLGEEPYYTENGGGQGYGAGPGASPDSQEKASQNRGAQENGTSQATSSNGHSSRQHVVADTEL